MEIKLFKMKEKLCQTKAIEWESTRQGSLSVHFLNKHFEYFGKVFIISSKKNSYCNFCIKLILMFYCLVLADMSLMEMACTKNHINLAKLLICLGITIESPLDLLTKILQKGHSKMFYLLTRTSQTILDIVHSLKPDGIENKIWQQVIEFRRTPLSLLELSRISIIGEPISYEFEELPQHLPGYIRLEEHPLNDQS